MTPFNGQRLWLPGYSGMLSRWFMKSEPIIRRTPEAFLPVTEEFRQLIENDATLFMYFTSMFDEIPSSRPYDSDPIGNPQIRDYHHMLECFNNIIQMAPPWNDAANAVGLAGFPINAILNSPMGTASGRSAFLDPRVNAMFKKMFAVWSRHLSSPASTNVLSEEADGWLCPDAMRALTASANHEGCQTVAFHDIYNCDPSQAAYGFLSWDDFFTRTFKDGVRPVSYPNNPSVIINPCESAPYRLSQDILQRAKFWVKGQPYSLEDMLNNDELVPLFVGGTVYQAFLSSVSYHRWHSPVSGTIIKTYNIPGTYYSETLFDGFLGHGPDPAAPARSQAYITAVASRAAIFIQADNEDIGVVCVLPVGMAEVSSCEVTVSVGQRVQKGQEIGMFHFGGSTVCLIFERGVDLRWERQCLPPYSEDMQNIAVRSRIATVVGPKVTILDDGVFVLS